MIFVSLLCVLLVVALGSNLVIANGHWCGIEEMPVVLLRKDPVSGEFSVEERYKPNANISTLKHPDHISDPQVRLLWSVQGYHILDHGFEMRGLMENATNCTFILYNESGDVIDFNVSDGSGFYYYARECSCFNDSSVSLAFCPMTVDLCLLNDTSPIPICKKESRGNNSFVNTMYYYLPIWILLLLFLCVLRKGVGANGRDFLVSLCIPKYREWLADRILRNNPERAQELYQSHYMHQVAEIDRRRQWNASVIDDPEVLRQHDEMQREQSEVARPLPSQINLHTHQRSSSTSLVLRTTLYRKANTGEINWEDDGEEESCSICVTAFVDGDRIGNLEVCNHKFHVDCLKQWLRRKNTCPLCQKEGIAKQQRTSTHTTATQPTSSDVTSLQSI